MSKLDTLWRYEWSDEYKAFVVYEDGKECHHLKNKKEAAALVKRMNLETIPSEQK